MALLVDSGLVDEHDGDFVADRVEAMAGDAAQAGMVGFEFDFRAAGGTDEDFEQFCADGQERSLAFFRTKPILVDASLPSIGSVARSQAGRDAK